MSTEARHILLIEDDEMLGGIIMKKLLESGYRVTWEKKGSEGLHRSRLVHPDLILLDLMIAGMSGEEVVSMIRKDADLAKVPVLVLSNSGNTAEVEQILSKGATEYLVKADFDPDNIVARIGARLGIKTKHVSVAGKRVLIVEDDEMLSSLSTMRFTKAGFTVALAKDGNECLAALTHDPLPDIVLLDIIMPGKNGFDVLREMHSDARLAKVPVVVFSNFSQEHDVELAKSLGAKEFFVKSKMTLREVVDRIGEMVSA
jgi:DNA-binding response OmpR family regulator